MPLNYSAFTAARRDEIDVELIPFEGEIPKDMFGHVFFNTPVGSVNSGGTPVPQYLPDGSINPEFGVMIFNGDGMIFRFDLNEQGRIKLKTRLLRTPCYYADEATKIGTKYHAEKGYYFESLGIAREGAGFGSRNQLNTAFSLFKFPGDNHTRLTANFDAGRPYEVDAETLKLKTPIGANKEWRQQLPAILEDVFELVQSTAHPSFDPATNEFFTVCFTKNMSVLMLGKKLNFILTHHTGIIEAELNIFLKLVETITLPATSLLKALHHFFDWSIAKAEKTHNEVEYTSAHLQSAVSGADLDDIAGMDNAVTIVKWTGSGPLQKWNVVDSETGQNLVIYQTMHQTNFSKDYIVLVDASLKFTLDIMMTNPFPKHPAWNRFLRKLLSRPLEPYTPFYLVKRSELTTSTQIVKAKRLVVDIETVHFSINYQNPNDLITMHTAHNAASCAAEWIRPYDYLALEPDKPVVENTIGLMTTGEMDLGRIGKIVVNGETGEIVEKIIISEKGFEDDKIEEVKAHTWAVGLNTFRDIISADKPVNKINQIYWQSYGLDSRFLTVFIKEMYPQNYKNRIVPVDELMEYYKKGVPFCLFRQNTNTMTLDDYYLFEMNQNFRSLQFVPRKRENGDSTSADPEMDGYIFCTMINGNKDIANDNDAYSREIWIFDAADLKKGAICKLSHPEMIFAFTIHSAWMEDCVSTSSSYNIPVKEDYDEVISTFKPYSGANSHKMFIQQFMDENVYPHF